jgi:hypothetical protein
MGERRKKYERAKGKEERGQGKKTKEIFPRQISTEFLHQLGQNILIIA